MTEHKWRVSADVPADVRAHLLQAHTPRFPRFFAMSLTWAYGVGMDYPFDPSWTDCTLFGLHHGRDTQAFLASFAGDPLRPDGRMLFLTFCTARGVPPVEAINIDLASVELIEPVLFGTQLKLQPLWVMTPQIVQPFDAPAFSPMFEGDVSFSQF